MVLPFPTRIPVFKAFLFTSLLVLVELLEGTDPVYSALIFSFFMLSVFAFNIAGGFSRPSGGYIFFFAVLAVELGTVRKAFTGQAAQTNLDDPLLLMSVHVAVMGSMLFAAYFTRMFVKTQDGMAGVMKVRNINYSESSIGCFVLWILMTQIIPMLPGGGGQILHSLNIVNPFLLLSVFLGTIAAVRNSGGTRSTTALTLLLMIYMFMNGLSIFSKQGMLTSVALWLIGASWARFRLRPIHIAFLICFAIATQYVFSPLATLRDEPSTENKSNWDVAWYYLFHHDELVRKAAEHTPSGDLANTLFYFGKPDGIFDRLSMLPNDGLLIAYTGQGHYFGYKALRYYFENWVPHLIDPHKLEGVSVGGNAYMHELGGLADEDTTTGISFSPSAELFHIGGWMCVLLVSPLIFLLTFASTDAVCGDLRRQPWGLGMLFIFAHVAPEGGIGGAISATWLNNVGTMVAIYGCGYITPVLGSLFRSGARLYQFRALPVPQGPRTTGRTLPA